MNPVLNLEECEIVVGGTNPDRPRLVHAVIYHGSG